MREIWKKTWFIGLVYALAAVAGSAQRVAMGRLSNGFTAYENYLIFKTSYIQLAAGANPYAGVPDGPWDLFKYSPAFALGMAPFTLLPDWLGVTLWNLLNALPFLYALLHLPILTRQQQVFCAWFVLPELVVSLQNSQSNGLTAAFLLLAWIAFERNRLAGAAGWIAGSAFIKIFGIFAAVPGLLYPRLWQLAGWLMVWSAVLLLVPLILVSPGHLMQVYVWWLELLRADQAVSIGLSVQGWFQTWFGWEPSKTWVMGVGFLVFVASVVAAYRAAQEVPRYRVLAWASLLLWVVIFNHKAESPTYIIAMCGVAFWYCTSEKRTWEKVLFWSSFVLASLSPTDIFPRYLREVWVQPYVLKAVPCILIWAVVSVELFKGKWMKLEPQRGSLIRPSI